MFEAIISLFGVSVFVLGSFLLQRSAHHDYKVIKHDDDFEAIELLEGLGKQTWSLKNKEIH
jgi:hypothetical protein